MAENIFPHFRHAVTDEPELYWTVEEVFQWTLLRSLRGIDERTAELEEMLRQETQKEIAEVVALEEQQHAAFLEENLDPNTSPQPLHQKERESVNPTGQSIGKPADTSNNNDWVPKGLGAYTLIIDTLEGEHEGKQFECRITKSQPAWVGRSRGKKFKKGISLPRDFEVSTTHGKFCILGDDMGPYFVDTGSTNGSILVHPKTETVARRTELQRDVPCPLSLDPFEPTLLLLGQSLLKVTIHAG